MVYHTADDVKVRLNGLLSYLAEQLTEAFGESGVSYRQWENSTSGMQAADASFRITRARRFLVFNIPQQIAEFHLTCTGRPDDRGQVHIRTQDPRVLWLVSLYYGHTSDELPVASFS